MSTKLDQSVAKRLLAYSTAAGLGAFAFGASASAAIVVTDLGPGGVVVGETSAPFDIDFDGDGFVDTSISPFSAAPSTIEILSFGFDEISPGSPPTWVADNQTFSSLPALSSPPGGYSYYIASFPYGTLFDGTQVKSMYHVPHLALDGGARGVTRRRSAGPRG